MQRRTLLTLAIPAFCLVVTTLAADQSRQPAAPTVRPPVDLNTASAQELEALPGIGPRTAQRILEYREEHGGFRKIEELMNVRGIGEKSFLQLRELVTVSTPSRRQTS